MRFLSSITLFASVFAGTAAFGMPCEIEAMRPRSLLAKLNEGFASQGIYQLPASMAAGDTVGALLRGNEIVAHVTYSRDAVADSEDLNVVGLSGTVLFQATQRVTDVLGSLTTTIEITPARDANGAGAVVPFRIAFSSPNGGVLSEMYDNRVSFFRFRAALSDSIAWLDDALVHAVNGQAVTFPEPIDQLRFALAQDASVLPYLDAVHLTADVTGGYVLTGVVPSNEVYRRVLEVVSAQGVVVDGDQIVIDTRTALPSPGPGAFDTCRRH